MHRSGLKVDEELKKDFASAQSDSKVLYVEIGIQSESFKRRAVVNGNVDSKSWAVLSSVLKPKTPTYLVTRVGASSSNKWLLIFYVPEDSIVREKMLYASSASALKEGLGLNLFSQSDFAISTPQECTEESFNLAMKTFTKDEIMTANETAKQEAKDLSSKEASDTKHQAMADIPLVVDDEANKEIGKLKDGKVDLIVLAIDSKEILVVKGSVQKISVDDIAKSTTHLPANEPRYLIYRYAHSFEDKTQTPILFLYYRPEGSSLKIKMTYSAMKQNVARIAEKAGIDITKSYEFSEPGELTTSVLLQELYPKSTEKKAFTKPRKPGKGAAGLVGGAKFSSKK